MAAKRSARAGGGEADDPRAKAGRRVAALNAAAERHAAAEAGAILDQAGALLLAVSGDPFGEAVSCLLPGAGRGRSMIDVQKFRRNYYTLSKRDLFSVARLLAARNWFARRVIDLNCDLFGSGFSLGRRGDEWLRGTRGLSLYPLLQVHDDMLREYFTTSNAVALWRKDSPAGRLPLISVPHAETVELRTTGGMRVLRLTFPADPKLPKEAEASNGKRMFEALRNGKVIEITEADPEWDFAVLCGGKSNEGLVEPTMTAVMDDLDFIEAVKAGDWNGAWRRRITILQSKKGYSITSGSNAGAVRTHAKAGQLKAMGEFMKNLAGHANAATNFDQTFEHIVFPAEFFEEKIAAGAYARLIHWSGLAGVLLMQSESRISGVSPYLMLLLRAEAEEFRRRFGAFLHGILNSESFLAGVNARRVPPLEPQWGGRLLHTIKELQEKAEALTRGRASTRTIREGVGLDHDEESRRCRADHKDPDGVIPIFEQNQGLSQARNPEVYPGAPAAAVPAAEPGAAGRPQDAAT